MGAILKKFSLNKIVFPVLLVVVRIILLNFTRKLPVPKRHKIVIWKAIIILKFFIVCMYLNNKNVMHQLER